MNFFDYALRDLPSNLFKRNGTTLKDIAIPSGTTTSAISRSGPPIVAGSPASVTIGLGATKVYSFAEDNFDAGRENYPFTLSIVLAPITVTQNMAVFGHYMTAPSDGFCVDQDNIIFRIRFMAGDVQVKWEYPDFPEAYLLHGVYTPNNIKLYVNGNLVGVAEVPPDYLASGFKTASEGFLYGGMTNAANDVAQIDAPASYPYALREEQVQAQFNALRDVVPMEINVASQGGIAIDGTDRRVYDQKVFNATNSWEGIAATNVSSSTGELVPQVDQTTGASVAGTWTGLYVIDNPDVATLSGIKAEWNGNGLFTVQSSLDGGTTWSAITNGELIPTSQGLNPAGKTLLVRVSFTGGVVADTSEVRDLTLTTYADNYIYTINNDARKLNIIGSVATTLETNQPIELSKRPGIHAYGGFLTMGQDTDGTALGIQTLEFIVNPNGVASGSGGYLLDTRPYGGTAYMWLPEATGQWSWAGASAVYINGQVATSPVAAVKGDSVHIIFVFPALFNTAVDIAAGQQVAEYNLIAAYSTAFTAAQAAAQFANYSSIPTMPVTEVGIVQFIEPANPYVFTSADWASLPQQ